MPITPEQFLAASEPTYQAIQPRRHGLLAPVWDVLERPSRAISEAVGAYRAGESPFEGFWKGLSGEYRYPTLGYQVFPKGREPGYQPEDVGAFAVDVLLDPLNWLGPGIAKVGGKVLAKGAFALGAKMAPKWSQILTAVPEAEKSARVIDKVKFLRQDKMAIAEALGGKGAFTWGDLIKRFEVNMPDPMTKALWAATKRKGKVHTTELYKMLKGNEWLLDTMRAELRMMDVNFSPMARTGLQSLAQEVGSRLLPVGNVLRRFGGRAGTKWADGYERALLLTAQEEVPLIKEVSRIFKGMDERTMKQAVMGRENAQYLGMIANPKAHRASQEMGALLDDFGGKLAQWTDDMGNPLMVRSASTGRMAPFAESMIPGYYPHMYPASMFTRKGRKAFQAKLMGQVNPRTGSLFTRDEAMRVIENISTHNPKRIGHIEMAREGLELGYEMNPRKVLPKYIHDSLFRKNLAKEFGVNNEVMDVLFDDMAKIGMDRRWLNKVADITIGRNIHDRFFEKLTRGFTGFQALTKLGYATTVANSFQAPMNQVIMHGFWNEAKALTRMAKGADELTGLAAYSRAVRDDVLRMGAGGSKMDKYMKLIGFDMSERKGRHLGALVGMVDAEQLAKRWATSTGKANLRAASELMRKYKIPVERLEAGGAIPRELLELAGLRAANKTMHAFNLMELPLEWRDPFWRTALQFKSFIYKQSDFLLNQMMIPGMRWLATDGAAGDILPLLRAAVTLPIGAELVMHMRDVAKSVPAHVYSYATKQEPANWNWKKPFWQDPDPGMRIFSDLAYIGTMGIFGDAIDAAAEGRMWKWAVGPTFADMIEGIESVFRGTKGEFLTKEIPGAFGVPYGEDVFENLRREYSQLTR